MTRGWTRTNINLPPCGGGPLTHLSKRRTATGGRTLTKPGVTALAGKKPLIGETRNLSSTIHWDVVEGGMTLLVGSPEKYASTHQFGARKSTVRTRGSTQHRPVRTAPGVHPRAGQNDPMTVAYESALPEYRPRSVAETAGTSILPVTMGRAYDRAKAGGKHAGWLKRYSEPPSNLVAKGLRSLEKQAEMHRTWIASPSSKLGADAAVEEVARLVSKKWPSDVRRIEEQMDILKGLLRERGDD